MSSRIADLQAWGARAAAEARDAVARAASAHRFVGGLVGGQATSTLLSTNLERALAQAHVLEEQLRYTAGQHGVGYECGMYIGERRVWGVRQAAPVRP